MNNNEVDKYINNVDEERGHKIVSSLFKHIFNPLVVQTTKTQPGTQYDDDVFVYDGDNKYWLCVESKGRDQRSAWVEDDDYFMFNLQKLDYCTKYLQNRTRYFYLTYFIKADCVDAYILDCDKYGKLDRENSYLFDGMPIVLNDAGKTECEILRLKQKNEYGIYYDIKEIRKCWRNENSKKTYQERLFISKKLFSHYRLEYSTLGWRKISNN